MNKYIYISAILIGIFSVAIGYVFPAGCPPCREGDSLGCGLLTICTPSPQLDYIVSGGGIIVSGILGMLLSKIKTSMLLQVTLVSLILIVTYLIYLGVNTVVI